MAPLEPDSTARDADMIEAAGREAAEALQPTLSGLRATSADAGETSGPLVGGFAGPPPDSFAGYTILKEIHRGGQGVVYQAFQKSTRRKVAIKVMREGPFAGTTDRARFEREIQVLGQLNHPNIVAIHDSGTAAGFHYFVMDYVSGQPLDVYMASGPRGIRETLELFAKICEAVNAAHLRGVIHRDLKPGNIRIDDQGEPRVLDFGLAKVATPLSMEETAGAMAMTATGQFVGSLPWASPEQAEGNPGKIDLRTDVYSLGVILYQMLTGKFPYEIVGGMHKVLDNILKARPVRPRTVRKQIKDEVEAIVLKCLDKERERRYQTAGELAREVRAYLAGEPISAKPPNLLYNLRVFARRNKAAVFSAIAIFAAMILGTALASWQAVRATQAEQRATREADAVKRVNAFYEQMIGAVDPFANNPFQRAPLAITEAKFSDVLRLAAANIGDTFADRPDLEVRVRRTLGQALFAAQHWDEGLAQLRASVGLGRRRLGPEHPATLESLRALGGRLNDMTSDQLSEESVKVMQPVYDTYRRIYGEEDRRTLDARMMLGWGLAVVGRPAEALVQLEPAAELAERILPPNDPLRASTLAAYATALLDQARPREAAAAAQRALETSRLGKADFTADWVEMATPYFLALVAIGRFEEAERIAREILDNRIQSFGEDHGWVPLARVRWLYTLTQLGRSAEAIAEMRRTLERHREKFGPTHFETQQSKIYLAFMLCQADQFDEAEALIREALPALLVVEALDKAITIANAGAILATIRVRQGRLEEARQMVNLLGDQARQAGVPMRQGRWHYPELLELGGAYFKRVGQYAEAEFWLLDAYQYAQRAFGPQSEPARTALADLVALYETWDKPEPATRYRDLLGTPVGTP